MRCVARFMYAAILAAFSCGATYAQGAGVGSITGIVSDNTGAVVPGVQVQVTNVATNVTTAVVTNDAGNYVISNLIPGEYQLAAENQNFKRFVREGLRVEVGNTERVDVTLEVGNVSEEVIVTAATTLVETESGARKEVIDNAKITQLPSIGRKRLRLSARRARSDTGLERQDSRQRRAGTAKRVFYRRRTAVAARHARQRSAGTAAR